MKLDFKSLAFGYELKIGGGTPAWETALGQGVGYKMKDINAISELTKGMIYKAVSPKKISFKKGKGGAVVSGDSDDSALVIAAVFDKVFINEKEIQNGKFIMLISKDDSASHNGRLKLKYGVDNTYKIDDENLIKNRDFIDLVEDQLGLSKDACWFVYDISVENQDTLRLRTIVVNKDGKMLYDNSAALHSAWDKLIEEDSKVTDVGEDYEVLIEKKDIFSGFQPWLTSSNNPDYRGQKYAGYANSLVRLVEFMKERELIDDAALNDMNVGKYEELLEIYSLSDEVQEYDKQKLSSQTGRSALKKYIKYIEYLINGPIIDFDYNSIKGSGINKIFYGTPGCGKSYHIEHEILGKDKTTKEYEGEYKKNNIIRTTFYQDYSNTDFVGQILPKVVKGKDGEKDTVEYIFNPGPFTLALIQAISNPSKKVALVIEEINRGNAPAIFGDIFQLLDRDENSISEYGIVNVGMLDYLNGYEFQVDGEKKKYLFKEIKIPGNMDIFATMNTSDQNVYTLDTAFVRRWEKEKIKNTFTGCTFASTMVPGMDYSWKEFVEAINKRIENNLDALQVNEDKQIGAFFVKESLLVANDPEKFAYKIFDYLWSDVAKLDHSIFFNNYNTLEKLIAAYVKDGVGVFVPGIFNKKEDSHIVTEEESNE